MRWRLVLLETTAGDGLMIAAERSVGQRTGVATYDLATGELRRGPWVPGRIGLSGAQLTVGEAHYQLQPSSVRPAGKYSGVQSASLTDRREVAGSELERGTIWLTAQSRQARTSCRMMRASHAAGKPV